MPLDIIPLMLRYGFRKQRIPLHNPISSIKTFVYLVIESGTLSYVVLYSRHKATTDCVMKNKCTLTMAKQSSPKAFQQDFDSLQESYDTHCTDSFPSQIEWECAFALNRGELPAPHTTASGPMREYKHLLDQLLFLWVDATEQQHLLVHLEDVPMQDHCSNEHALMVSAITKSRIRSCQDFVVSWDVLQRLVKLNAYSEGWSPKKGNNHMDILLPGFQGLCDFFGHVTRPFNKIRYTAQSHGYDDIANFKMLARSPAYQEGGVPLSREQFVKAVAEDSGILFHIQLELIKSGIEPNPGPSPCGFFIPVEAATDQLRSLSDFLKNSLVQREANYTTLAHKKLNFTICLCFFSLFVSLMVGYFLQWYLITTFSTYSMPSFILVSLLCQAAAYHLQGICLAVLVAFILWILQTIEKNPGPVFVDGPQVQGVAKTFIAVSQFDGEHKFSRAKLISRQKDEKKKRNQLMYKHRFAALLPHEKGRLSGDVDVDFEYFHQLLVEYGYASDRLLLLPSTMINLVFQRFEEGYGLQHYEKILRLYHTKGLMDLPLDNRTPEPGRPARALLIQFFFREYAHKFPHLNSVLCALESQMFEGILSSVGEKIANGFRKEIQPVWDSIVSKITSFSDGVLDNIRSCSVFLSVFAFSILVGTIGIAVIYRYRQVLFSYFSKVEESNPSIESQTLEVCTGLVTKTFTSWCEYMGALPDRFIAKFSEDHMTKTIKKFGDLASAFNNIHSLITKLRDVAKYIIDKSWKFIFGVSYFTSTLQLEKAVVKINELLAVVRTGDIHNKGTDEQKAFVTAFEDLNEMCPFVGRFDPALQTQINLAMVQGQTVYTSLRENLRFTASRQKPVWVYLFGEPGRGKTVFTKTLCFLVFEKLRREHPDIWKAIGKEQFDQTLLYSRQSEQEYWDRYANQWVTIYDDLLQQKDPQSTEAFSLIRAKTDAPYPLHMASIARKETTTFQSKLIISSTNATENSLKSMSGITDYRAFCRRRDLAIHVDRVGDGVANYTDFRAVENLIFTVYNVDPKEGTLGKPMKLQGIAGAMAIVEQVTQFYVAYANVQNFSTQPMTISDEEWSRLTSLVPNLSSSSKFSEVIKNLPIQPTPPPKTWKTSDKTEVNSQCRFRASPEQFKYLTFATYWPVTLHPTLVEFIHSMTSKIVSTPQQVKDVVEKMRKLNPVSFWRDPRFDNVFVRYGIKLKAKLASTIGYIPTLKFSWPKFFNLYIKKQIDEAPGNDDQKVFCNYVNQQFSTNFSPRSFTPYIGLTNEIYHHKKRDEILDYLAKMEFHTITYDYIKSMSLISFKEFETDSNHEITLRKYKGDSCLETEIRNSRAALAGLVGGTAAAVSIIWMVRSILPQFVNPINEDFVSQSNAKYLEKLRKETAKRPITRLGRMALNAVSQKLEYKPPSIIGKTAEGVQSQFTDEQSRAIAPIISHNTYVIEVKLKDETSYSQFCTGLTGNTFVTAAHLFNMPNISEVRLYPTYSPYNAYAIYFEDIKYQYIDKNENGISNRDLVLFTIPSMNHVRTITQFLPSIKDELPNGVEGVSRVDRWDSLNDDPSNKCTLYDKDGNLIKATPSANYVLIPAVSPAKIVSTETSLAQLKKVYEVYLIHNTQNGDCGKSYLWFNPSVPHKFMGIHTAGNQMMALISPLFKEDVETYLKWLDSKSSAYQSQFRKLSMDKCHVHPDDKIVVKDDFSGSFMGMPLVATLSEKFVWPRKTKLLPTPLCSTTKIELDGKIVDMPPPFPIQNAPAILSSFERDGETFDPVPISLRQMSTKVNRYVPDFRVREFYDGIFCESTKYVTGKFITKAQAIKGVLGWLHLHPTPRNTSMAFYWQKEGSKGHFVLTTPEHYDALPLAQRGRFRQLSQDVWLDYRVDDLIDAWFEAVRNGKIPPHFVLFCLKDEPRPLDRVFAAKTRAFFMGSFVLMIVTKMIFGDFMNALETYHNDSDSAVGINPYSMEWTAMYNKLKSAGVDVIDDDTSGFDINFPVVAFCDGFPEIYCLEYNLPPNSFEAACVFAATYANLCMYTVLEDKVYLVLGMPSGCLVTCFFNTLENSAENRAIVKRICPHVHFVQVGVQKCFGDDIIQAIRKPFQKDVSRPAVRKIAFDRFNHTRTDSTKSDAVTGFSDLHSAWFLQRTFFVSQGVVLAPLNIDSINCMLQYIMKPKDKTFPAQFRINVDQALMELVRHGEVKFNLYKNILNKYLSVYGNTYKYTSTYEQMYVDMIARATS